MTILRRREALILLAAVAAAPRAVAAEDYPSRPVRIIAPFGAGGPTDVFSRIVADELQRALHQAFVIENRPGAGTTIGTDVVAHSPPDGYTLLMVSATQCVNETLFPHKHYKLMQDLAAVAPLIDSDLVLVVHPSVPVKTLADLLALARAKPGTLNYGSSGPGSNYHMAAELLRHLTGINIVHVPYKGSTGARNDIISGNIQLLFDSVPTMAPLIKAGMVRALGSSGKTRSPILPEVPTIAEAGVPQVTVRQWAGVFGPPKMPREIVERLNRGVNAALKRAEVREKLQSYGYAAEGSTPERLADINREDLALWRHLVKEAAIPLE